MTLQSTQEILARVDHRPYPLPARRWSWRQNWHELLFAHWRVDHDRLRRLVPEPLELDAHEGAHYLGVVPFHMSDVSPRFVPAIPGVSAFPELNVRTYVRRGGVRGVYFLSLDATQRLAVVTARALFHLPYFHAQMERRREGDGAITYRSRRPRAPHAEFRARYRATSAPRTAAPGSLEHFFVERYCLFALNPRGVVTRTDVHHAPWMIHDADAELDAAGLLQSHDLVLPPTPDHLHFAEGIAVRVWAPIADQRGSAPAG